MVIASSLLTKEIKKHYWHRIITPQHNRPMSIYSGFATRQLEEQYDTYTQSLISNIQKRLLKFYRGEASDDSLFFGVIRKLYHAMRKMEKYKYLEPKLSENFRELLEFSNPERLMTKDPTEAMNRITEERSERDLTMQSPPLFMHIPQAPVTKSRVALEQYEKEMRFNPYHFSAQRPMTTRPSAEFIPTIPEEKHTKHRSHTNNKHHNQPPSVKHELEKHHVLKYYRASRNIKLGKGFGKNNHTLDLPP